MRLANNDLIKVASEHLSARRIAGALAAYNLAQDYGYPVNECAGGRWKCWMLLGKFELAWQESELIEATGTVDTQRFWDGCELTGKRILLRTLHGLGDAVQFIRYASQIRRRAKTLSVQTHPSLVALLRNVDGVDEVSTWPDPDDRQAEWDQQIEVMELPRIFRTTLDSIPARIPYISLDRALVARSAKKLCLGDKPKVGLLWASSDYDPSRSVPLRELAEILSLEALDFYSFQHGPARAALGCLPRHAQAIDTAVYSPTVLETAVDLANMDLFISVDSFAAHLAGAIGCRVWLMLPFAADWRWMIHRHDSPWYPAMRLFRQPCFGDWTSVVSRIKRQLINWTSFNRGNPSHYLYRATR